jgi:hypothetical protein
MQYKFKDYKSVLHRTTQIKTTYIINVAHRYSRRHKYELYQTVAATGADRITSPIESCHNINGAVKRKRLNCLILRAVLTGALEELKKFVTYYIANSPIERVTLRLLQETLSPLGNCSSSRRWEKRAL